jgi:hypothetical protein
MRYHSFRRDAGPFRLVARAAGELCE